MRKFNSRFLSTVFGYTYNFSRKDPINALSSSFDNEEYFKLLKRGEKRTNTKLAPLNDMNFVLIHMLLQHLLASSKFVLIAQ